MSSFNVSQRLVGIQNDVLAFLKELHAKSTDQEAGIDPQKLQFVKTTYGNDSERAKAAMDELMLDKFIALDEEKCHFIHSLLISTRATTSVEIGTSFGVSTIYIAGAVGFNAVQLGIGKAVVIGTEKEESKAKIAKENWKKAGPGIEKWIQLKEGDLMETLAGDLGLENRQIDFVLLDIWTYVALPALKLLLPKLRPGAIIVSDNIISSAEGYKDLISVLRDPEGDFQSITLPYKGGLELSVYQPFK